MADEKVTIQSGRRAKGAPTGRLTYPKGQVYADHTDYVLFQFWKYKPPFAANAGGKPSNGGGVEIVDKDGKKTASAVKGQTALNIYNNSISNLEASGLPQIAMYMPEDLGTEYGATWGGKGFTNNQADILKLSGSILNNEGSSGFGQAAQALGNFLQRADAAVADAVVQAVNAAPGSGGSSVGINDVLGGVGGVILNPNTELLFSGFDLRGFGLNFKMTPRNKSEAKGIRDIITTFKRASLPGLGASAALANFFKGGDDNNAEANENRNFIDVPNLVTVRFMSGSQDHPYLTKYKPLAITSVRVNYTPDGQYATYDDGSPVATTLQLAFTESKLVFSNEITYGGASF